MSDPVNNYVKKEGDQWFVYSKDGKKLSKGYDTEEAAKGRLKEIEYFKHKKNALVVHKSKTKAATRADRMEDRDWTVVPMVMLVEGVHNGSCGALYYPKEELEKTPQSWNHKPVVVYHPVGDSACTPDVLTNRKIGVIMNTKWEDGKLKAEAWLDMERTKKIDNRVAEALEKGTTLELSTGLFTDTEGPAGDWNNETYDAIARNYRPDHLAVLPDMTGACSMVDGAGFLRLNSTTQENTISDTWAAAYFPILQAAGIDTDKLMANEISHNDIWRQLNALLQQKSKTVDGVQKIWYYLNEVYSEYCVYEGPKGDLYKQRYELKDDVVKLTGVPEEVVREVSYKVKNENIKNVIGATHNMEKKTELIQKLLGNTNSGWTEKDKVVLDTLTESQLEALLAKAPQNKMMSEEDWKKTEEEEKEKGKKNAEQKKEIEVKMESMVGNKEDKKPLTAEEYISNAPSDIQEVLKEAVATRNFEKEKLTKVITDNKNCAFSKEFLSTKPLGELRGLAKLAEAKVETPGNPVQMFNYSGQAEVVTTANAEVRILDLPTMNFGPEKK